MQRDRPVQRRGEPGTVGHHQKAAAGARDEIARQRQHVIGSRFIEIAGRLVGKQEQRPGRERPADRDPLLLTAGELLRVASEQFAQSQPLHELGVPDGIMLAGDARLEGEVVLDREARDQVELLEHEPEPVAAQRRASGVGEVGDGGAVEPDLAAIGGIEPRDQMQQRALSGARFAGQCHALASGDVEIDPAQHGDLLARRAIGLGQLADAQHGSFYLPCPALRSLQFGFGSFSTNSRAITVGLTTLLICRIILGAGEGPAFSVATHAIYKWFPDEKRTLPTAILSQGSAFGVILAVPALNWVIVHHSWHYAFGSLGVAGLVWVVAWLLLGKEGPLAETRPTAASEPKIPYSQLLTSRTFVGCVASTFGAYWALSLGLTWFTPFIVKGLGFSQQQAGFISVLPWVFGAAVVLVTGWVSQV